MPPAAHRPVRRCAAGAPHTLLVLASALLIVAGRAPAQSNPSGPVIIDPAHHGAPISTTHIDRAAEAVSYGPAPSPATRPHSTHRSDPTIATNEPQSAPRIAESPPPGETAPLSASDAKPLTTREALPLSSAPNRDVASASRAEASPIFGPRSILQTLAALGVVLALIFLLRACIRRLAGSGIGVAAKLGPGGRAPSGVLEVLGRYPVARGTTLVLLKIDRRVLLLSQSADGFQTLCEITDPEEVASILIKTRDDDGETMSARFSSLLRSFERDQTIIEEPYRLSDRETAGRLQFPPAHHAPAQPHKPLEPEEPVGARVAENLKRRLSELRGEVA